MTKPEKKLQDNAIKYLKSQGIYHLNLFGDGWSGKGKPDLIACINGKFLAFELNSDMCHIQDDILSYCYFHLIWQFPVKK